MSNKITTEKINELWQAWQQKQSLRYVSQMCNVSKQTVTRYRIKENWDERLSKIKKQVQEKADMKQSEQNAKYLKIAESTINQYAKTLGETAARTCPKCGEVINVPKIIITPLHFEKMVRLIREELSSKDTESKAEQQNITLDELSLETRKQILHEIKQKYKKIEQNQ